MTGTARVPRIDPKSPDAAPRERPRKAILPVCEESKKLDFRGRILPKCRFLQADMVLDALLWY